MTATTHTAPCGAEFDTAEDARSHELLCDQCAGATEAARDEQRRCNWCGSKITQEGPDVWLDAMDDAGCENNGDDGHQPEPIERDCWQEGNRADSLWLDDTVTMPDSPVSVTFRHVLGYGLVNSNDEPVTYDLALYRTYHAAGTNVPELDAPWHLTGEPRTGWTTKEAAQAWAEKGSDIEAWDFDNDPLYQQHVEMATAVRQSLAARDDRLALDKIATLLATSPDWNGDHLTMIADLIGGVRPHPGDRDPDEWAGIFYDATGRPVPHVTA